MAVLNYNPTVNSLSINMTTASVSQARCKDAPARE
jgi:hypothetical protein